MRYAIVFPGQGSQVVNMLADLYNNFSVVRVTFLQASDILDFDLWSLIQTDADALNRTVNTQVAMLVAGYAVYRVLKSEIELKPLCMAGHSLGEYSALVAAGMLDFSDAIKLVKKRAELMQSAVPLGKGAMAAILGLDDKVVQDICLSVVGKGVVEVANFNSPGQVVIAGDKEAVAIACTVMKTAGAKRTLILPVSVASHCSLMKSIVKEFEYLVNNTKFNMSDTVVLHNIDATKAGDIDEVKYKLIAQLYKPVLWSITIRAIMTLGVDAIIECGPRSVLSGLNRRIDKSLIALCTFDFKTLTQTMERIK